MHTEQELITMICLRPEPSSWHLAMLHLLGAAGGVEFITCVKTIQDGFIHQTVGTEVPDEECDLNYAIGAPVEKEVHCVLTNSLGFGGHNATLLLKKYEG